MAAPPVPTAPPRPRLVGTSAQSRPGSRALRLYRLTIGKKAVMAVSGIVFLLFLVLHMLGNLKIFIGKADYNNYAAWLRTMGSPALPPNTGLVILDIILIVCVLLHIGSAVELALRARRARPVKYAGGRPPQSYASRTVRVGAILIVLFIVYHLLDLTALVVNPKGIPGDPYDDVVADFRNPLVTIFYVICLIVIGFHIRHGIWSATQTLGWGNGRRQRAVNIFAIAFSVILIAGFLAVPIGVVTGVVH
ncbi:MAG TPA: succinate dehydrogenase cytochrome b subunit [Trebonia sp.]|jgi:succinate dehydrogenase / fumarate reductase cytochrome b subunit|nr:succinate dehydrogenase cytochrome b subunit [Trebonia sp.]